MKVFLRLALSAAFAAITVAAHAANGDIDTTFGTGGLAFTGLIDAGGAAGCKPQVQSDGKIVICGTRTTNGSSGADFFVARFNADGSPDTDFSFDGSTTIDFDNGTGSDAAFGIALAPGGKIVVVGSTSGVAAGSGNFAVAQLLGDGTLDTTFGAGTGKATIEFDLDAGSGNDAAGAVAIQADGRIVASGSAKTATGSVVAVTRLLPDGTRDSSFNLNGKVTFSFGVTGASAESDTAFSVAIDAANRIVIGAGVSYAATDSQLVFGVARLLPGGQLDSNFHANGHTTIAFDPGSGISTAQLFDMIVQRDGRIVAVGGANASVSAVDNTDVAIVRLLPDGSPDSSFGLGGKVLIPFDLGAPNVDAATAVTELADGRLLIVGTSLAGAIQLATAARLTRDGALDQSFGVFGKKTYDFALTTPRGQAFFGAACQGNSIIASGAAYVPPGTGSPTPLDIFVTRLEDDTIFANGLE